jgi:hypothetical protein
VELHLPEHLEAVHSRVTQICPFCQRVYAAKGKKSAASTIIVYSFDELDGYNRFDRTSNTRISIFQGTGQHDADAKEIKLKVVYILKFMQELV